MLTKNFLNRIAHWGTQRTANSDLREFLPNADLLDLFAAPHLWNINSVDRGATSTKLSGWCLPLGGRLGDTGLQVNGRAYPIVPNLAPAGKFAELYPWHPNAVYSGFSLDIANRYLDDADPNELHMHPVSLSGSAAPGCRLHVLVDDLRFTIPEPEIAARIGVTEALHYTMFGRSIFRGFENALISHFKSCFADTGCIVDWGCGSGRVSRHISKTLKHRDGLRGFDVDAHAVAWSNENIGRYFSVSQLQPPLDISTGSADAIIAYSVFTHLPEEAFNTWLGELARVLKPDGALLFTVLSDYAMASLSPSFPRSAHEAWIARGIYDDSGNNQLNTIDIGGEAYRNTWVKREFLKRALAAKFEFVDYVSPFHFYQDLVVARRRS